MLVEEALGRVLSEYKKDESEVRQESRSGSSGASTCDMEGASEATPAYPIFSKSIMQVYTMIRASG